MEKAEEKVKKTKLIGMVLSLLFLIVLVLGLAFAIFEFNELGKKENAMTTGTLTMEVDDASANEISLTGAYPITDEEGLAQTPYTFTVRNTGTLPAKYRLRFVKDEASYPSGNYEKADTSHIKYGLKIGTGKATVKHLNDNDGVIVTDKVLTSEASETYSITIWIESEPDIPDTFFETKNIEFHGHVQLEAIQEGHTDYTTGE